MNALRKLLLASAAVSLSALPVLAAGPVAPSPIVLAQAGSAELISAAEQAVEEARAALRQAMATGSGIDEARQALRNAIAALDQARAGAGLPPSEDADVTEPPAPPPVEAPPPADEPPPVVEEPPPPPEEAPPPPPEAPPVEAPPVVDDVPPPPAEAPAAIEELAPPSDAPALEEIAPPSPVEEAPPVMEAPPAPEAVEPQSPPDAPPAPGPADVPPAAPEQPPVEAAPAEIQPSPEPTEAAPENNADQPAAGDDGASGESQPSPEVQAEQPAEPVVESEPPPVIELPIIAESAEPPPPPPPPATDGEFQLERFTERPRFGDVPAAAAEVPAALPQAIEAIRDGATIVAPAGRVIVKHEGQVQVLHDDSQRFRQRGDRVERQRTANDTETISVRRPDGTEVVTVRDRYGNIIQRYVKERDGSVRVLIGDAEQPGFVGRMFGRGAQPAPPPPRRPPAINLQLGPIQLNIPTQEYIVESSRADQQRLQQTLMAPPVERVERAYTLEEVRRNGRLRDKVRRIDFDTVTFDTGKATIADSQIAKMQTIGTAMREIIDRDPTQVFLIEGHTDAVGSDLSNLALSDRRAETVAQVLSYYFGVPPENIVTQGYGEQFLKVPTVAANQENRRVAFRNITYLLRASAQ